MRIQGTIKKWKEEKGYGFVSPDDGGSDIFVHINGFSRRSRTPKVGNIVTFERVTTVAGKTWAERVLFQGERDPQKNGLVIDVVLISVALFFLLAVTWFVYLHLLPLPILVLYLIVSMFTFLIYRLDKSAAQYDDWRTSENQLHTLALFGGWPGALIAQRVLHHKSKKKSFQTTFWFTAFLNVIVTSTLLSPEMRAFVFSII